MDHTFGTLVRDRPLKIQLWRWMIHDCSILFGVCMCQAFLACEPSWVQTMMALEDAWRCSPWPMTWRANTSWGFQHMEGFKRPPASWQAEHQRSTEVSPMKCFSRMMGGLAPKRWAFEHRGVPGQWTMLPAMRQSSPRHCRQNENSSCELRAPRLPYLCISLSGRSRFFKIWGGI